METLRFDSDDLEATEDFLSRARTRMAIGGDAERTRARVTRNVAGPVGVDRLSFDYDMRHDAAVLDGIRLGNVHSGGIGTGPVRLAGDRPVSPAAARHLRHTIAYLADGVCADEELSRHPLLVATAAQLLAAAVLNAFPSTAPGEPTAADRRDARPAAVRRAVAFVEDNAHREITVADIAAAAHVSIRSLQEAFRRHLDTTPTGYLCRVRLARAHADLLAARPGRGQVAAVAARWGFVQPGRFAAAYRAAYGRLPHETLREDRG
ncbi:hypothetical protein GCM10018785_69170 [Streptomyces longispororuber]|uniref:HTH araC/xylS-type domain-containing protein n=1 Tax=Streptomyces longispororuber TaxID=68230 RepID=A0A919DZB4_9ACTN|nr:helix-turn-helix domain-containing protein [Streptomyces longispororuber]GHE93505.1 hypothetical protein GCM10018785_69170 [Streptomyces longispororuber]